MEHQEENDNKNKVQKDVIFNELNQIACKPYNEKIAPLELDNLLISLVRKYKEEVYQNLGIIDSSKLNYKIAHYKFIFQGARNKTFVDQERIDQYLAEFNVEKVDDFVGSDKNELWRILLLDRFEEYLTLNEYREIGYDVTDIRKVFYHYYLAKHLDDILVFLDSLLSEPKSLKSTSMKKVKLNLTVAELSYLFRLLDDSNFIKEDDKAYRKVIVDTFSTKKANDISYNSFKNKFNEPDPSAIDGINKVLLKLLEESKKFL